METSQETEEMKKSELQYKEMKNLEEKTKKGQNWDKKLRSIVSRWKSSWHDEDFFKK
jgi:hypothetical protein